MLTPNPLACLTPQPFRPKLRLIRKMFGSLDRTWFCVLLLGIIFLAAQFHFCTDLTAGPSSHICPICNAASSATVAHSFSIAPPQVANRLESPSHPLLISIHIPRSTSPRAPPSLC